MKGRKSLFIIVLLMITVILTGCPDKKTVSIGYRDSTEHHILAQMFSKVIRKETPYETVLNKYGNSELALQALKEEKIDVYPEEMEMIYYTLLGEENEIYEVEKLQGAINDTFNEENVLFMDQLGYEKRYALAMTEMTADKYGINTMTDLEEISGDLNLAASYTFLDEEKGIEGMKSSYEHDFKTVQGYDSELRYIKLGDGDADIVQVWTTDGYVKIMNLILLEDDLMYFEDYHVAPLISAKLKDEYPDIIEALEKLEDIITAEDITNLQIKVIEDEMPADEVAEKYLKEKGIID
ncbi:ABC transporter substrate-binding protein [Vallitalea okinawensis]|uniref:ABC transporter substrate-binding protein n=1 Tax=Vallitalea okinawensis TaxID=2078660 RepID=UPI00147980A5|nr:glycine betaine ABC transporter substrate-binding protein [Vallitalea okinawensis]